MVLARTLKGKLLGISIISAGSALLAACIVLGAYDYRSLRETIVTETQTYADVVAENSTAALSFHDANDAAQTLAALKAEPHIVAACVYDQTGKKLATWFRSNQVSLPERNELKFTNYRFGPGMLEVCSPARLNGQMVGLVYVRLDLDELTQRTHGYLIMFGVVLVGALGLALALSGRMNQA